MVNALQSRFGLARGRAPLALDRLLRSAEQAGYFRTAPDRLLRPRTVGVTPPTAPGTPVAVVETASIPTTGRSELGERAMRGADHLLIRGALAELPEMGTAWTEDDLTAWMELIETAVRVIYRLPRPKRAPTDGR